MARVVLLLVAALVLGWSSQTDAAENTCARLARYASGEMIENRCVTCRVVNVQRTRPGVNFPTNRTLTIPKRTRQTVPFRGPGQTRITADRPCPGVAPEPSQVSAAPPQKCVRFLRDRANQTLLINPCAVCRSVKIELVDDAGNRTHRAYAIAANSPLGVPSEGLSKARILADGPCS